MQLLAFLEISRVFIAVAALGTAERALELALEWAKQRVTFGKPIAERQAVRGCRRDGDGYLCLAAL